MSSGVVVWISGLPQSGKSTLASRLRTRLIRAGRSTIILDGDRVRDCLRPPLGYSTADRNHFYETLARLAAELARQGLVVLVPATAHRRAYRARARRLARRFVEVYLATPLHVCARRDRKNLYARALQTPIPLPGARETYEAPRKPDVVAEGGYDQTALEAILRALRIRLQR